MPALSEAAVQALQRLHAHKTQALQEQVESLTLQVQNLEDALALASEEARKWRDAYARAVTVDERPGGGSIRGVGLRGRS